MWSFCPLSVVRCPLLVLILGSMALAGDEQAPGPPSLPRGWTPSSPATPSPSAPSGLDEARLSALIDDAVDRALARHQASAQAAYASPQSPPPQRTTDNGQRTMMRIVPTDRARTVGTVPAYSESRDYVQVMVPAPLHKRALAAIGQRLVECGQPRVRTMRVAPAAVVQEVTVQPARAVYPTGQGG